MHSQADRTGDKENSEIIRQQNPPPGKGWGILMTVTRSVHYRVLVRIGSLPANEHQVLHARWHLENRRRRIRQH